MDFAVASDGILNTAGKWQPGATSAGSVSDGDLVYVNVSGTAVSNSDTPNFPSNTYLSDCSS